MKKYILMAALVAASASPAFAHWDNMQMNDSGTYDAPAYMSTDHPLMLNEQEDKLRNYDWSRWNHQGYEHHHHMKGDHMAHEHWTPEQRAQWHRNHPNASAAPYACDSNGKSCHRNYSAQ